MTETNATTDGDWVVKFVPFSSTVESSFWVRYCKEKLETIRLSEEPIPLRLTYNIHESSTRVECLEGSLTGVQSVTNNSIRIYGSLIGFNTLESFQKADKNQILNDHFCHRFLESTETCFTSAVLLTFPDLKNHKVLYWFGFPALLTKSGKSIRASDQQRISDIEDLKDFGSRINDLIHASPHDIPPYFMYTTKSTCMPLTKENYESVSNDESLVFGFFDPINVPTEAVEQEAMGWPMRNLMAFLSIHLKLEGTSVNILSCRSKRMRGEHAIDLNGSLLLTVTVPMKDDYQWDSGYKAVGWESNARSKPGPRWVNLRPLLDPKHLAIQAADLNLKLMKWRMIPGLDVEKLKNTKVLLIGAGTLGCSVARVLLGWGIRSFKIVDYGKVSYSNPVRQSLFTMSDCEGHDGGGRAKAVAAAEALRQIAADVESEGIVISIPMPGHAETMESLARSVATLDALVQECDVVYLLTDTRESRWLPTLMAAAHNKMLVNAALGLDSWLVMRHGGGFNSSQRFGCYFCNDVVAPENSTKNRTLDQQCTVTRPGLAPIASSMAVELMVSLLHHPDGTNADAPAPMNPFSPIVSSETQSPLGVIPHQIRGSLVSYTMMTPTVPAFHCCTGCSRNVVDAYETNKLELVYQACQSIDGSYLENVSGLTAFRRESAEKMIDFEDWEEDEE